MQENESKAKVKTFVSCSSAAGKKLGKQEEKENCREVAL